MDFYDQYESVMYDMSKWIQERTWGGHEAGCPRFGTNEREGCECIFGVIHNMYKTIDARTRDSIRTGLLDNHVPASLPDFTPRLMDLQAQITWLEHELSQWRANHG